MAEVRLSQQGHRQAPLMHIQRGVWRFQILLLLIVLVLVQPASVQGVEARGDGDAALFRALPACRQAAPGHPAWAALDAVITRDPTALSRKDDSGRSALAIAMHWRAEALALHLLRRGASASEVCDAGGLRPLHLAARFALSAVCTQLLQRQPDAIDQVDAAGASALTWAVRGAHETLVQQLLDAGADPLQGMQGQGGLSPSMPVLAALRLPQAQNMVAVLLAAVTDPGERWPQQKELVGALAQQLPQLFITQVLPHVPKDMLLNTQTGETLLHRAVLADHAELVQALWQAGHRLRANRAGRSAVHVAAVAGRLQALQALLDHADAVTTADAKGVTPLMAAVSARQLDAVAVLLAAGADTQQLDKRRWGVLQRAAALGSRGLCDYLFKAGARVQSPQVDLALVAQQRGHFALADWLIAAGHGQGQKGAALLRSYILHGQQQRLQAALADVQEPQAVLDIIPDMLQRGNAQAVLQILQQGRLQGLPLPATLLHTAAPLADPALTRQFLQLGVPASDTALAMHVRSRAALLEAGGAQRQLNGHRRCILLLQAAGASVSKAAVLNLLRVGDRALLTTLLEGDRDALRRVPTPDVLRAILQGRDPAAVLWLRDHGLQWQAKDVQEHLPMLAMRNQQQTLQGLLEAGVPADARAGKEQPTALQAALVAGHGNLVDLLLAAGADPEAERLVGKDASGYRPIMLAIRAQRPAMVRKLLACGVDVHGVDADGYTLLHHAVAQGDADLVARLLAAGVSVNAQTKPRQLPGGNLRGAYAALHLAVLTRDRPVAVLRLLLKDNGAIDAVDAQGRTAYALARMVGHPGASLLAEAGADIASVDEHLAQALAAWRADDWSKLVRLCTDHGNTRQQLISAPPFMLHALCRQGARRKITELLALGVAINVTDRRGRTPLFDAVAHGHVALVKEMLAAGADAAHVARPSKGAAHAPMHVALGWNPFGTAPQEAGVRLSLVKLLLAQGAAVDPAVAPGPRLLSLAAKARFPQVMEQLLRGGAGKPDMAVMRAALPDLPCMAVVLAGGFAIDAVGPDGRTALHHAAVAGQEAALRWLLRRGAQRGKKDSKGMTAADLARLQGHAVCVQLLESSAAVPASSLEDGF